MVNIITSFTAHQTPEGMRTTYTYSTIDEDGNLIKANQRATCIVLDENINGAIDTINAWLLNKVNET